MNQQDAAVNLQDVLDSLSRGIPAAIREEISLCAMGMALGQFLSSTHDPKDYDAIIEAMSNNNRDTLCEIGFSPWAPFENTDITDLASYISDAAFSFEESLLWAYGLAERNTQPAAIVITLDGGLIQGVDSNVPMRYLVHDHDTEGCDINDVAMRPSINEDGKMVEVYASGILDAEFNQTGVKRAFDAVKPGIYLSPIPTGVDVTRWDGYGGENTLMTHEIVINDQREANGQVYIDVNSLEGSQSQPVNPAITIEVQNLNNMLKAENTGLLRHYINVPVFHLHFDNSSIAASFFHEPIGNDRSRFLMRLETDVSVKRIKDGLYEIVSDL